MKMKLAVIAVLVVAALSACDQTTVNRGDATKPVAEIKTRQVSGSYEVAPSANLGSEPLELAFRAYDPDGIRSLKVEFASAPTSCTDSSGAVNVGRTYPMELPEPMSMTSPTSTDTGGLKTHDTLGLPFNFTRPTCRVPDTGATGVAYGEKITVRLTATNWSSDSSTSSTVTELTVWIVR